MVRGDKIDFKQAQRLVERGGCNRHEPFPVFKEKQVCYEVVAVADEFAETLKRFLISRTTIEEVKEPLLKTTANGHVSPSVQDSVMRALLVPETILPIDKVVPEVGCCFLDFDCPDDLVKNAALADICLLPFTTTQPAESFVADLFLVFLPVRRQP